MKERQSQEARKPTAAFVLALIAGLWMLATRGVLAGFGWNPGMRGHWMWGHSMMRGVGGIVPVLFWGPWFGIIAGIVILLGAVILYSNPAKAQGWGVVILIVSALSLAVGMGGFLPGVLGIIGGALAIAWRP
jgi:hypothetical protein